MNKLKIIESKQPKVIPIRNSTNTFKIKRNVDKTTIHFVR